MDEISKNKDQLEKEIQETMKNVLNGLYEHLQGKFQCDASYSGSKVLEVVFQTIMDLTSQISENSNQLIRDQSTSDKGITPTNVADSSFIPRTMSLSSMSVPDKMQSEQVLNTSIGTSQGPPLSPVMDEGSQASDASSLLADEQVETSKPNKLSPMPSTLPSPSVASISSFPKTEFVRTTPHGNISKLYDLSDDPERKLFLDKLIMYREILYQEGRSEPLTWCPIINRQPLDLYKLYLAVKERGGFVEMMRGDMWHEIAGSLGIGVSSCDVYDLKYMYVRHLLLFECKYDRGGIDPEHLISSLQSKSKKRNAESADKDTEIATLESSAFQCDCPAFNVVYKKCHDLIQNTLREECRVAKAFKAAQDHEQLRQKSEQLNLKIKQLLLKFDSPPKFHQDTKEKATGVMDIEDYDLSASTEKLSKENVFSLYASAHKHDVHDQKEACHKFIKNHLSVGTFWETFRQCLQYPELNFIDLFLEFCVRNACEIFSDSAAAAVIGEYCAECIVLTRKMDTVL